MAQLTSELSFLPLGVRHTLLSALCLWQISSVTAQTISSVPNTIYGVYIRPDGARSTTNCHAGWTWSTSSTFGGCCATSDPTCYFVTECSQATKTRGNGQTEICDTTIPRCVTMTIFDTFPSSTKSWLNLRCGDGDFSAHTLYRAVAAPTNSSPSSHSSQPSDTGAASMSQTTQKSSDTGDDKTTVNVLGIVLGVVLGLAVVAVLGFLALRKRRKGKGSSGLPPGGDNGSSNRLFDNGKTSYNRSQKFSFHRGTSAETGRSAPTPSPSNVINLSIGGSRGSGFAQVNGGNVHGLNLGINNPIPPAEYNDGSNVQRPDFTHHQTAPAAPRGDSPSSGALLVPLMGFRTQSAPGNVYQLPTNSPPTPELGSSRPLLQRQQNLTGRVIEETDAIEMSASPIHT
ncbi:hypothetical protein SMACR_09694 [Sordaria macrospora]|nr:hypothetical protein SMACR_09694 [Sordaria macrospora]WPJ64105.1 hypothetical protein SMAC4_09694 [Sordaria macrospora]